MTTQTRYHCHLDPADAKRLRAMAGDSMFAPPDIVRLAVLAYLRARETRGPVARLPTDTKTADLGEDDE